MDNKNSCPIKIGKLLLTRFGIIKETDIDSYSFKRIDNAGSLLLELDEYRKFRHLVRHNYQVKLKAYQVLILAQKIIISSEKVKEAITTFNLWLDSKANSVGA